MKTNTNHSLAIAVMLIGLSLLLLTGWWWPGIMLVVGTARAVDFWVAGRRMDALGIFALFLAIPVSMSVADSLMLPWTWAAAAVVLGVVGWRAVAPVGGEAPAAVAVAVAAVAEPQAMAAGDFPDGSGPSPEASSAMVAALGGAPTLATRRRPALDVVEVSLFGVMEVLVGGLPVQNWRTVKARDLLAYFLLHDRPLARSEIMDALWPETDPETTQGLLHTTLYYLRRNLRPAGEGIILFSGGAYRVNRESLSMDLDTFHRLASGDAEPGWAEAVGLYRDDLLTGLDYAWCEGPRAHARRTNLELLKRLARHCRTAGRLDEAITWLQQLVQTEPLAEEAQVDLMECYAATGNRNAALQQYRTLARLLDDELGLEPSSAAQALYRSLLQ